NSSITLGRASATRAWIQASSSAAPRSDDDAVQAAGREDVDLPETPSNSLSRSTSAFTPSIARSFALRTARSHARRDSRPTKRSTYSSKYAHCAAVSRRIFPASTWRESESMFPPFQSPSHPRSMSQQRQKSCGGPLALQQRQGVVVRVISGSAGGRPHTSGGGRWGRNIGGPWWSSSPPPRHHRSPPIIRLSRLTPGEKPCTEVDWRSRSVCRVRVAKSHN
ncbi:hypothetical protein DFJ73DRAFT_886088, partial [Zopfochytrium polystomum]